MPLADMLQIGVAVSATTTLAWAAVSDIRDRRIPNLTVVLMLVLALPWIAVASVSWASALIAGAIALVVCFALYAFGVFGGGDAKLFAAVALFAGLGDLLALTVATAMAGGALAAASFASRPRRALVMLQMRGRGDWGRGVPYGVAIALGGSLVLWARVSGIPTPISLPL